jgi:glycine/D-amino acid oxidase-like deaminating enzyme
MAEFKADVVVLSAGMVGVSAALHLQQRERDVILVEPDALWPARHQERNAARADIGNRLRNPMLVEL